MAKAYWITATARSRTPDALAAYAKLAGPSIQAAGDKFLVRGRRPDVRAGMSQRTVVTEWESVAAAVAGHDSRATRRRARARRCRRSATSGSSRARPRFRLRCIDDALAAAFPRRSTCPRRGIPAVSSRSCPPDPVTTTYQPGGNRLHARRSDPVACTEAAACRAISRATLGLASLRRLPSKVLAETSGARNAARSPRATAGISRQTGGQLGDGRAITLGGSAARSCSSRARA